MMDFDTFLDATSAILIPGTLPTLILSIKSDPSSGTCVFPISIERKDNKITTISKFLLRSQPPPPIPPH